MIPVEISDAADADLVGEHPAIGSVHDVVRPPIRSLPHGHRIFYDIFSERILVQRILHQSVDIERHL